MVVNKKRDNSRVERGVKDGGGGEWGLQAAALGCVCVCACACVSLLLQLQESETQQQESEAADSTCS